MINTNNTTQTNLNNDSGSDSSNVNPEIVKLSDYMKDSNEMTNTNKVMPAAPVITMSSDSKPPMVAGTDTIKPKKKFNLKMLLGVMALFLVMTGSGVGFYLTQFTNFDLRQQAWFGEVEIENNAQSVITNKVEFDRFVSRQSDISVGNITVSTEDLENLFLIYYEMDENNNTNVALWTEIATKIIHEAALQDFASREGFLDNIAQKFDPRKAVEARTYFEQKGTNHVSGEVINLWFYNTDEPTMGVKKAREIQKQRIDDIHKEIVSGNLTMVQAADKINAMTEIGDIDPVWVGNTYTKFEYTNPDEGIFNDEKLNRLVWNLKLGQVSDVLVGQDFDSGKGYDAYFSIIKLYEKETNKESNSVEEVIEKVEIN